MILCEDLASGSRSWVGTLAGPQVEMLVKRKMGRISRRSYSAAAIFAPWLLACAVSVQAAPVPTESPTTQAPAAALPEAVPALTAEALRERIRGVYRDIGRIVSPEGIDEGRIVELGGFRQWIAIRGQDRRLPVLLFLHGGPGSPISSEAYTYQRPWEDFFTVVNWDQRGFGKSWGSAADAAKLKGSLNRAQYIADTIELIEYLTREFKQPKVVLVGQSWGASLALEVAHRRADLLYAVVPQGLEANWLKSPELVREALIVEADRTGNTQEAQRLRDLGPPPPPADLPAVLKWGRDFDVPIPNAHTWHNIQGLGDSWARRLDTVRLVSPDLSAAEFAEEEARMTNDMQASMARYQEAMSAAIAWDAVKDVGTHFSVPVVLMMGRHDWQASAALAKEYYDKVCAPWKRWVEFPQAAHVLNLEQPGVAIVSLVNDVLPAVHGKRPSGAQTCATAKRAK